MFSVKPRHVAIKMCFFMRHTSCGILHAAYKGHEIDLQPWIPQVNGMELNTKDKKTCACFTPAEATAEKEICCSSDAHTVAEVQALYQLPEGHPTHSCLLTPCTCDMDDADVCKVSMLLLKGQAELVLARSLCSAHLSSV